MGKTRLGWTIILIAAVSTVAGAALASDSTSWITETVAGAPEPQPAQAAPAPEFAPVEFSAPTWIEATANANAAPVASSSATQDSSSPINGWQAIRRLHVQLAPVTVRPIAQVNLGTIQYDMTRVGPLAVVPEPSSVVALSIFVTALLGLAKRRSRALAASL